jgi:hypothetical protein
MVLRVILQSWVFFATLQSTSPQKVRCKFTPQPAFLSFLQPRVLSLLPSWKAALVKMPQPLPNFKFAQVELQNRLKNTQDFCRHIIIIHPSTYRRASQEKEKNGQRPSLKTTIFKL